MKKIMRFKMKICWWKRVIFEILETLSTICRYLEEEGSKRGVHNRQAQHFYSHYNALDYYSEQLRREIHEEYRKIDTLKGEEK